MSFEGRGHLGTLAVVLQRAEVFGQDLRIADHAAILPDEGHASLCDRAESVRQVIPIAAGVRRPGIARRPLGHEVQAHVEVLPDTLGQVVLDGGEQVDLGGNQGHDEQSQRNQEQLATRPYPHGQLRFGLLGERAVPGAGCIAMKGGGAMGR